ncbi:MAG TPA: hypothetical protein ENF55_02845 [Thermoprotei archaeon]|nr:hypothetical protein [Thermoprotei archaeon]
MSSRARVFRLRVGKRGEIYTTKELRRLAGIRAPGEVVAIVTEREIIIKKPISLKELLSREPVLKISFEEAERISEKVQEEYGL